MKRFKYFFDNFDPFEIVVFTAVGIIILCALALAGLAVWAISSSSPSRAQQLQSALHERDDLVTLCAKANLRPAFKIVVDQDQIYFDGKCVQP